MPSIIDTHPQREKIIDSILGGTPVRDIAAWTNPPVSFNAIQRYKKSAVRPAMQRAEVLSSILIGANANTGDTEPKQLVQNAIQAAPVLAVSEKRIAAAQDRHDRLQLIVSERQIAHADVPGGKSGLLVQKVKQFGSEFLVDTGLLSEFREHEKQIAQELGQWQESKAPSVAIQIVMPAGPAYGQRFEAEAIEIAMPKR